MTTGGYMGRVLFIDLNAGDCSVEEIKGEILRKYIGGTGLSAYLMARFPFAAIDPLGPENPLIFSTGPLTGTNVPTTGRYAVVAKSPLTGLWGESDSGSRWGMRLKGAGYDALVLKGRAQQPSYLFITEKSIEIRPALHLWGSDTYKTFEWLQEEHGPEAGIVCIGPAGEKLIPMAGIMSEGHHGRAAGRCGMGAVMGAKNLKAIVAAGNKKPPVARPEELMQSVRRLAPVIAGKTKRQRQFGTAGGVVGNAGLSDMSAKNWTVGNWVEGAEKIGGEVMARDFTTRNYHCPTCIIGCGKTVRVTRGAYAGTEAGGPEYETIAGFGAQCMVEDMAVIIEANDLCNRWGLDTISASGSIAFLLEAAEKGLVSIPREYPPIWWGNGEAVIYLLHRIMDGEGLGGFLRKGVREMARMLGGEAGRFAIHVRGLEFSYHDPRALSSLAVAYATHPRGACHRGCSHNLERFPVAELGYTQAFDRFQSAGKGAATAAMQNYAEVFNCLKLCQFIMSSIKISDIVEWLNAVTGWDFDVRELLLAGERSVNLKRILNLSCGSGREEDTLPPRILEEPFSAGGAADHLPALAAMLNDYYSFRGWDERGVPCREKLAQLGLENYDFKEAGYDTASPRYNRTSCRNPD